MKSFFMKTVALMLALLLLLSFTACLPKDEDATPQATEALTETSTQKMTEEEHDRSTDAQATEGQPSEEFPSVSEEPTLELPSASEMPTDENSLAILPVYSVVAMRGDPFEGGISVSNLPNPINEEALENLRFTSDGNVELFADFVIDEERVFALVEELTNYKNLSASGDLPFDKYIDDFFADNPSLRREDVLFAYDSYRYNSYKADTKLIVRGNDLLMYINLWAYYKNELSLYVLPIDAEGGRFSVVEPVAGFECLITVATLSDGTVVQPPLDLPTEAPTDAPTAAPPTEEQIVQPTIPILPTDPNG